MIRYVGNLNFREVPGTSGPNQAETGLDTLVRTFRGKTADKYIVFNVLIGTPDGQFPQLFVTNVDPVDLEGGLTDFRVTYKGMLTGQPRAPKITDSRVIKSGTVNGEYVYEVLLPTDDNYYYSSEGQLLVLRWRKRAVNIQVSASYYAPSTTFDYVSKERPTGPKYQAIGVRGYENPIEFFNTVPAGEVQIKKPQIYVGFTSDSLNSQVARYRDTPPKFLGINISESNKKIICSNFTAEQQGVWWACSETWEMEIAPILPESEVGYEFFPGAA
jgi:hypothetical protein